MNRGEIWWAESPAQKRRPYLVLTRQIAIPVLHSVLTVPATRTVRAIATQVELDRADGMPHACALALDNLTLMPKSFLVERITHLNDHRMAAVCHALQVATGC